MTRNKKKKHDKILMSAESKFNSIETLISQALDDLDINHEELKVILNENDKCEKMKYNLIGENGDEKQGTTAVYDQKINDIFLLLLFFF